MGVLDRLRQTTLGRRLFGSVELDEEGDLWGEDDPDELARDSSDASKSGGLSGWVEQRAHSVVSRIYANQADDIEDRAKRAVSSAYRESADDLEQRAVRAMRRAIRMESERIKAVIEHSVRIKKREVRLSLLVLILASLVYLVLYYVTNQPV